MTLTERESLQQAQNNESQNSRAQPSRPSLVALLRRTFEKWYIDNIPRHAAALAFYTLFAIAPLLLFAVEVMSLLYGRAIAEQQLTAQIEQYVHNAEAAALAQTILNNALPSSANWFVTIGIIIALIYGASAVFGELQIMLNIIWGVHYQQESNFRQVIWQRIVAIIMVILSGLLIVVGLVITLWYSEATSWVNSYIHTTSRTDQFAYFFITLGLTALVFALIYKYIPDVDIAWHDILIGAVATAFLVSIARLVITLYMSYNRIGSVYGAAGSLVILLLWVYYSAQIFFLGAEFTHVYSRIYGAQRNQENDTSDTELATLVVKAESQERSPVSLEVINLDEEQLTEIKTKRGQRGNRETEPAEGETEQNDQSGRWFNLPQIRRPRLSLPDKRPTISLPKPTLPNVRKQAGTLRQRITKFIALPLRIFQPVREIMMAVGVIGALSLAALFGFPWNRHLMKNSERHRTKNLEANPTEGTNPEADTAPTIQSTTSNTAIESEPANHE